MYFLHFLVCLASSSRMFIEDFMGRLKRFSHVYTCITSKIKSLITSDTSRVCSWLYSSFIHMDEHSIYSIVLWFIWNWLRFFVCWKGFGRSLSVWPSFLHISQHLIFQYFLFLWYIVTVVVKYSLKISGIDEIHFYNTCIIMW